MGINLLVLLLLIGIVGLPRFRMRYDRLFSWMMFFASSIIVYNYCIDVFSGINEDFQYLWSKTKLGNLFVSFKPQSYSNYLIVPILCLSTIVVLNNNIFHFEERRCYFNSLIIFNSVALCLLVTAENYVQILTTIFISDILGYILLKNVDSSHRYVIYNFFADMCLFSVFALVCGKLQSLDIRHLVSYHQIGRHKDYVSILVAIAIFIKIGCFPFYSYLLDVAKARFHRMNVVNLLFSPLCGFILLTKLHNILTMSDLFLPLYLTLSYISLAIGICGLIIKDNILYKTVYLNMALFSALLIMLKEENFVWQNTFSYYYIIMFLFNLLFFKIYLYQNREENVSDMLNSSVINSRALKTILLQITLLSNIFITLIYNYTDHNKLTLLFVASLIFILSLTVVLNHIYKSPHDRRLDYLNKNNLRIFSYIINISALIILTVYLKAYSPANILFIGAFLSLINFPIFQKIRALYYKKFLQSADYSRRFFYYIIFIPVIYLSKKLWVMVDFVLSEKIITSAIETINRQSITLFFKLNPKKGFAGIIFIIIGIAIFVISFIKVGQ